MDMKMGNVSNMYSMANTRLTNLNLFEWDEGEYKEKNKDVKIKFIDKVRYVEKMSKENLVNQCQPYYMPNK
jgi:hypothetical protein